MFNTISKRCLLCLRLVSYGASLLWSGFIRRRRRPTFRLCASHGRFRYRCCSPEAPRMWMKVCLCCVLKQYTCVCIRLVRCSLKRFLVPQDDRGSVTSSLFHRVPCSSHETSQQRCIFLHKRNTMGLYKVNKRGDECYLPPSTQCPS